MCCCCFCCWCLALCSHAAALYILRSVQIHTLMRPCTCSAHRTALLNLLVAWAEASPAVGDAVQPPVLSGRVAISSIEHDRVRGAVWVGEHARGVVVCKLNPERSLSQLVCHCLPACLPPP